MTLTLAEDYTARLGIPSDMRGHLPFLRETAAARDRIVELGVRTGNSTCAFLTGLSGRSRGPGHLWSIDISPPDVPAHWRANPRWSFLQADDLSALALAWAPQVIDVLFIDTDPHSYDGALAELRAYGPRVAAGGVILMHDTHPHTAADPARALQEYARITPRAGKLTFVTDSHGLGILEMA